MRIAALIVCCLAITAIPAPLRGDGQQQQQAVPLHIALQTASPSHRDVLVLLHQDGAGDDAPANLARAMVLQVPEGRSLGERFVLSTMTYDPTGQKAMENHRFTRFADRMQVTQMPAVVLLDDEGRPYALVTELNSDPQRLCHVIAQAGSRRVQRDDLLAKADKATGVERAALLDRAMQQVTPYELVAYESHVRQIVQLGSDQPSAQRYRSMLAQAQIDQIIQHEVYPMIDTGRYADARKRLAEAGAIESLSVEQRQLLRAFAAQVLFTEGKRPDAIAELRACLALAPDTPAAVRIRAAIQQMTDEP